MPLFVPHLQGTVPFSVQDVYKYRRLSRSEAVVCTYRTYIRFISQRISSDLSTSQSKILTTQRSVLCVRQHCLLGPRVGGKITEPRLTAAMIQRAPPD